MFNGQLDIKLEQFTLEKLIAEMTKNKRRKSEGLNDIPPEVWKTRKFDEDKDFFDIVASVL